jgi:DNA-binding transcriptional regulator YhcF (GntR family)
MKPGAAFGRATGRYEQLTDEIKNAISEYAENHGGFAPSAAKIAQNFRHRLPDVQRFISALVEEHEVADRGGKLTVLSVFKPRDLLASTTGLRPAYLALAQTRKTVLREIALALYLSETKDLPEDRKIPVPVEGLLEREGFSIEFRNLARRCFGYNDPTEKQLYLSRELTTEPGKKRLVLMHEYFHIRLDHGHRTCDWESGDEIEAEATYAAIHYLIPLHTFDGVVEKWKSEKPRARPALEERIAEEYQVSLSASSLYLKEQGVRTLQAVA